MDDRIPDPSPLTTAQVQREVAALEKLATQRMDAIEKAVAVAHENLVRVPTDVDKAIGHLRELTIERFETTKKEFLVHQEKFASVQTQFQERDVRTEQTAKDSKVAVDAALQAAKEAVGKQQEASDRAIAKQEAATGKQIESITLLIASNNKALDDKISDLKERFAAAQGSGLGHKEATSDQRANVSANVAIIGLVVAVAVGLLGGGLLKGNAAPLVAYIQPGPAAVVPGK